MFFERFLPGMFPGAIITNDLLAFYDNVSPQVLLQRCLLCASNQRYSLKLGYFAILYDIVASAMLHRLLQIYGFSEYRW